MIASAETGAQVARALDKYNVVLLAGHGSATVSTRGPEDALQAMINLEQLCKMNWLAFSAVGSGFMRNMLLMMPRSLSTSVWPPV